MFGTYVSRGELILYPFVEYYRDNDLEYKPADFGVEGDTDFRGRYRAHERLLFLAYGVTEDLAIEFEAADIHASLDKAAADRSFLPSRLEESGLGDVETQVRWRWRKERGRGPELFSYSAVVFPHDRKHVLTGTPGWEVKAGAGLTRGFRWGTVTARGALEYSQASTSRFDLGEYAIEYLKRISRSWRVYTALEGAQDELALVTEAQWFLRPNVFVKVNNGVGLTSKATDWAPEVGILFAVPLR
jgi:hypothetical protein